jgi:hypothetical protein
MRRIPHLTGAVEGMVDIGNVRGRHNFVTQLMYYRGLIFREMPLMSVYMEVFIRPGDTPAKNDSASYIYVIHSLLAVGVKNRENKKEYQKLESKIQI